MTYTISEDKRGYWFKCHSALAIKNGPFKTWQEAKDAADFYVKNW